MLRGQQTRLMRILVSITMIIFTRMLAHMEQAQPATGFFRPLVIMIGSLRMPSLILIISRFQAMSVIMTLFRDLCISLFWIAMRMNRMVLAKHRFKLFGCRMLCLHPPRLGILFCCIMRRFLQDLMDQIQSCNGLLKPGAQMLSWLDMIIHTNGSLRAIPPIL